MEELSCLISTGFLQNKNEKYLCLMRIQDPITGLYAITTMVFLGWLREK